MPQTKAEVYADLQAQIDAALINPDITDKRHLVGQEAQLKTVMGGNNPTSSGGTPTDITAGIDGSVDIDLIKGLLTDIKSELVNSKAIEDLLLQDSGVTPRYFVRQEIYNDTTNTSAIAIVNLDGTTPSPPPVGLLSPVKAGSGNLIESDRYIVETPGAGYNSGDSVVNIRLIDGETAIVGASTWFNTTSRSVVPAPPAGVTVKGYEDKIEELLNVLVAIETTTSTNLENLAIELGSNADVTIPATNLDPSTLKGLIRRSNDLIESANPNNAIGSELDASIASIPAEPGTLKAIGRGLWQGINNIIGDPDDVSFGTPNEPGTVKALIRYCNQLVSDLISTVSNRSQFTRITNGTIDLAIKATAPLAADNAAVVALSPNSAALNSGSPIWIRDVAVAAINTTTTGAIITPTWGDSFQIEIIVTGITGVGAQLKTVVQETIDENFWIDVYKFPPITTTGSFRSPIVPRHGAKYRIVETVTGTTPVITRSVNRLQRNGAAPNYDAVVRREGRFNTLNAGFDIPLYGRTRRIVATNRTANLYFWQIHDNPAAIASGAVPLAAEVYQFPATSTISFTAADLGEHGTVFGANPRLALSTTFATYTPLSAVAANSISCMVESL